MKRKSPLRKVSKLKHRLAKRFIPKKTKDFVMDRSKNLEGEFQCERVVWTEGLDIRCPSLATTIHHLLKRSQGGNDHDPKLLRASCSRCNSWAEEEPIHAIEEAWSIPWRGYSHPKDFESYLTSKGLK